MDLKDRFRGCLLGLALGDALGAPFEGSPPGVGPPLEALFDGPPPVLGYTDDTEMAIGVAESIVEAGNIDPGDMARRFVENYHPWRGYGPGTVAVLELIRKGVHWEQANRAVFPGGSFGNGAAMRSAPMGLFIRNDMDRLRQAVRRASAVTHAHVLAQEGAFLIAAAVASAAGGEGREETLDRLRGLSMAGEYAEKLAAVASLLKRDPPIGEVIRTLGTGVAALMSVPTALYAFLRHGGDYQDTVRYCISLGGDTDTIAAMAGAITGAHLGAGGLPGRLVERLEDRERIEELACRLANPEG
jgi:poly(ADP-ribose) glycohydrolase ARH3